MSPERRQRILLAVVAVLLLAVGVLAGVLIAGGDGDPGETFTAQTAPTATTGGTTTTVTTTEPAPPTATTVAPGPPTITQEQAKAAAARGASAEAARGGIGIPPSDWDVRCTAGGGGPRATRWTCQAASSSGQCAGTIVAYARNPDVAATTEPRIGCGE